MRLSPTARYALAGSALTALLLGTSLVAPPPSEASSHREAPLIADDPLADNTDVYAFRSGDNIAIYANFIGLEDPEGGPNFVHWAEDVRYEIHVKNRTSQGALGSATDDITYRFTFTRVNEDPTTFFNIRLGAENLHNRYRLEKSTNGGQSFTTIVANGDVPQANIGPRSNASAVGINQDAEAATVAAVETASTGERVFAGPRDDPFFVDLGGVFDLGNVRQQFDPSPAGASNPANARDALAGRNVHTAALLIPIAMLQKDGLTVAQAANILDPNFVIGVWASASRPQIRTLTTDGTKPTVSGPFVQVSRLGMPLTNEAIIPIGMKDLFNATTPYEAREQSFAPFFVNPELALYMGNGTFGAAVPNLSGDLRIPTNSYPAIGDPDADGSVGFNFNNQQDGVFDLVEGIVAGTVPASAIAGTAFAVPLRPLDPSSPTALAADNQPRRVDIFPIFFFGVPNLSPYQLATGKTAGPLSAGKPFINNFLPITQTPDGGLWGGDMLRLNMAVPVTDRSSSEFRDWARLGLLRAAAIGLTVPAFNNTTLEAIPHMDGFPNGRRLEDDVVGIELQAVGGVVLAAVGLPQDDAVAANYSDLASPFLLDNLDFLAGPTRNDVPLRTSFPFMANPHRGYDYVKQLTAAPPFATFGTAGEGGLGVGAPQGFILEQSFPNPSRNASTIRFVTGAPGNVRLAVYDVQGRLVQMLVDGDTAAGTHEARWNSGTVAAGTYIYRLSVDGEMVATRRATVVR